MKAPPEKPWRERRHYHYPCAKCGKPAETVKKRRARLVLCQKHRIEAEREELNKNQMKLC